MKGRTVCALVVLLALSAACNSLVSKPLRQIGGRAPTDEEHIAVLLDDVHRGLESRRIYKVLAHMSPNYRDHAMRDYKAARQELQRLFDDYRKIRITRVGPRITVRGERARAIETFGIVAEPLNREVSLPIGVNGQIEVFLDKSSGVWQIVGWRPVGEGYG